MNSWAEPVTLHGHSVRLEPLGLQHFVDLRVIGDDLEIWAFMSFGKLTTPERLRAWIEGVMLEPSLGTGLPFAIIDLGTERACGSTSLYGLAPQHKRLELGRTWLGRDFWRTRVNTECKYVLLRHAFESLGCNRVEIKTNTMNLRSQAAIERLGATREGVMRSYVIWQDGSVRDTVLYSLTRSEWPDVKAHLEGLLARR